MFSLWGDGGAPFSYQIWAMALPFSIEAVPGVHLGYAPSWPHTFDVAAGFSAVVGFHAGLSPGELLDFASGLIGLDMARDDGRAEDSSVPPSRDLPPVMILPPVGPRHYLMDGP
jgi:hypothetical protein